MIRLSIILVLGFLALGAGRSMAAWDDTNVSKIIDDVKDVRDKVLNGDIPDSAQDLKRQLVLLRGQGIFITETVPDILEWLHHRRTPLRDFLRKPDSSYSCAAGSGSQCADFRVRLKGFANEFAELRSRFPAVEKLGLAGGGFGAGFVDIAPGFVLFGLHEILDRVPDWEYIPADLADIYDEIGDADAFSIEWRNEPAARAKVAGSTLPTPTQKFCTLKRFRVDRPMDPVRLNRIKMGIAVLKTIVGASAEFMPDQLGADLVGEGACCLKFPFGPALKAVSSTIELIAGAFETYRANLNVCRDREREIELHLTGCAALLEYKMEDANTEAHSFVARKIEEAKLGNLSTESSQQHLSQADFRRRKSQWGLAYRQLCDAYKKLGE